MIEILTWTVCWNLDRDDHRVIINLMQLSTLPMENLRKLVKICKQHRELNEDELALLPDKFEQLQELHTELVQRMQKSHDELFRKIDPWAIKTRQPYALDQLKINKNTAAAVKSAKYQANQANKKMQFIREELSL